MPFPISAKRKVFGPSFSLGAFLPAFLASVRVRILQFAIRAGMLHSKTDHLHNPRRKSCRSFDLVSSGQGVLGHGGSECENSGPNPKTWLQGPRSNPQDRPPLYLSGLVPTCDIGRNSPKEDYLVSASWSVLGFCRRDKGGGAC